MKAWIVWIAAAGLASVVAGGRADAPVEKGKKPEAPLPASEARPKPVRMLMDCDAEEGAEEVEGKKDPAKPVTPECAERCKELAKTPGRVEECCGRFNASHEAEKGASVACHIPKKCCAEAFAKTGRPKCPECAKAAKRPPQAEETKPLGKPDVRKGE